MLDEMLEEPTNGVMETEPTPCGVCGSVDGKYVELAANTLGDDIVYSVILCDTCEVGDLVHTIDTLLTTRTAEVAELRRELFDERHRANDSEARESALYVTNAGLSEMLRVSERKRSSILRDAIHAIKRGASMFRTIGDRQT